MPAEYEYDVFISFSSGDRPWALHLYDSLQAKGFIPFLDQRRLRAGARWEPQLFQSVKQSRHLIILWSDHAKQSKWMDRELTIFQSECYDDTADKAEQRLIFVINLEGQNDELAAYQRVDAGVQATLQAAYPQGIDALDVNLWQETVDKIVDSLDVSDEREPIRLAILTMTGDGLARIDAARTPPRGKSMNAVLADIGIGSKDNLALYYGEERTDWKPFADVPNLRDLLSTLLEEVNRHLDGPTFRLDLIANVLHYGDEQTGWKPLGETPNLQHIATRLLREINHHIGHPPFHLDLIAKALYHGDEQTDWTPFATVPSVQDLLDNLLAKVNERLGEAAFTWDAPTNTLQYNAEPTDWTPFGAVPNIQDLLNSLLDEVNGRLDGAPFRWEAVTNSLYYEDERTPWKPLSDVANIQTILSELLNAVNNRMKEGERRFRWDPVSPEFWSEAEEDMEEDIEAEMHPGLKPLKKHKAVLVIDPLALYEPVVKDRFDLCSDECLSNDEALFLALPPLSLPARTAEMRKLIRLMALRVYKNSFPPVSIRQAEPAQCCTTIGDRMDVQRWLLKMLGIRVKAKGGGNGNGQPYTEHGNVQ